MKKEKKMRFKKRKRCIYTNFVYFFRDGFFYNYVPLRSFLNNIKTKYMYPAELVLPMKAELTENGFEDLTSAQAIDDAMKQGGTTLLVINSVCGCSAGTGRPGAVMALKNASKKPTHAITAFAGFDSEAVQQARTYLMPYPPSSPCIALLKDGELVHMVERHMIEGRSAQMVANNLMDAFEKYC